MAQTHRSVHLFAGTHKGAFRFTGTPEREDWEPHGPYLKGDDVNHLIVDSRNSTRLFACVNSPFWGSNKKISSDFGETWINSESEPKFGDKSDYTVKRIWCIETGGSAAPNVLYAGVDPAALFRSDDNGNTWKEISGLTNHYSRGKWQPSVGGLMVHSVCTNPVDLQKLSVGISAAGAFFTEDGGSTWEPRNKGVLADFQPDTFPVCGAMCPPHGIASGQT